MTNLSPAAQAVLDAYQFAPIEDELTAAAVLRAAAEQLVPYESITRPDDGLMARQRLRQKILSIAYELETLKSSH